MERPYFLPPLVTAYIGTPALMAMGSIIGGWLMPSNWEGGFFMGLGLGLLVSAIVSTVVAWRCGVRWWVFAPVTYGIVVASLVNLGGGGYLSVPEWYASTPFLLGCVVAAPLVGVGVAGPFRGRGRARLAALASALVVVTVGLVAGIDETNQKATAARVQSEEKITEWASAGLPFLVTDLDGVEIVVGLVSTNVQVIPAGEAIPEVLGGDGLYLTTVYYNVTVPFKLTPATVTLLSDPITTECADYPTSATDAALAVAPHGGAVCRTIDGVTAEVRPRYGEEWTQADLIDLAQSLVVRNAAWVRAHHR